MLTAIKLCKHIRKVNIHKLTASLKKEFLLLWSDKAGLSLMFAMPLLLVFVITVIQDSALKVASENRVALLVANHDRGSSGEVLLDKLQASGLFELSVQNELEERDLNGELLSKGRLMALYIPETFTEGLEKSAREVSTLMLRDLGMDYDPKALVLPVKPSVSFYFDPVLQENFTYSIQSIIRAYMTNVETSLVIDRLYADTEIEVSPDLLKEKMLSNRVSINAFAASRGKSGLQPNSTQHNVPAWTIFAMFFMVVSLGANVVKERINGSFLRLKTMPTSFFLVIFSKMLVYVVVAVLQVALIFSIGVYVFGRIGLHPLTIPAHYGAFAMVVLLSSLAAVSYALLIGVFAKSNEQANAFGAISIVLFAALGGIWVPTFVMPDFMQVISKFSPLQWCLQGFYILFLKEGSWDDLKWVILYLLLFVGVCQLGIYLKLRAEKLV